MRADFLVVSDLHVDEYERFSKMLTTSEYGAINSRLFWCLDIFDQIQEYGDKNGCKTLLIGGDVFDKRGSISVRAYTEVFFKLARLVEAGWEIFSIVGNHDQAIKTAEIHALQCFPIEVAHTSAVWESQQGFKVAGIAFHENVGDFYKEIREVAKQKPDLYLIHQGLRGAIIAGDEILSREDVRLEDIRKFVGQDAWVLSGHYHIHQEIDPRFHFIGSSIPKDFGDKTEKGFLHFKNGELKQIASRAPKFITIDAEQIEELGGQLDGHYVQVRYEGAAPVISLPNSESLLMIPRKVEREYQSRVDISAENSPRMIFGKYLESFGFDNDRRADLTASLEELLGGYRFGEKIGSAKVSFSKIEFKNFLRFGETSINLHDLKGMVLIEGENKDDESSISNGAGKSSVFEGLRWALYGSTLRGVSGDEVVNTETGKECWVKVFFEVDGQEYIAARYRKHHKFKNQVFLYIRQESGDWEDVRAKSDKDTTDLITKIIGADERVFDSIVFLGYGFNTTFAGLTDKEQKQILENILGISYISELLEKARAQAATAKEDCTELNIKITYLDRQLEEKKGALKGLIQRHENSVREERERLEREIEEKSEILSFGDSSREEANVAALKKELKTIAGTKKDLEESMKEGREVEAELSELLKQANENLKDKQRAFNKLMFEVDSLVGEVNRQADSVDLLRKSREEGICPTCSQTLESKNASIDERIELTEVDTAKKRRALAALYGKDIAAKEELKALEDEITEIQDAIDATRVGFTELRDLELAEARKARVLAEEESNLSRIKATINAATAAFEKAKKALSELETKSPYQSLIDDGEKEIAALEAAMVTKSEERRIALQELENVKFWETAFSDKGSVTQPPIKSFILESVVPVLDEFARRYSEVLSSGAIEVRFNTISRLKSGELREQFSVEVSNRYGSVDYRGDSGGERRKVDISIMFALHALSRLQTGTFFNLVCLDEVLDSLDKEGCDRVAELLRELANEIETIFVITHNENLVSKFGSKITVVKKDGYSTIFDYTSLAD